MSEEEYQRIYANTKNNSIGEEKKSPVTSTSKSVDKKINEEIAVAILATSGVVSAFVPQNNSEELEDNTKISSEEKAPRI